MEGKGEYREEVFKMPQLLTIRGYRYPALPTELE